MTILPCGITRIFRSFNIFKIWGSGLDRVYFIYTTFCQTGLSKTLTPSSGNLHCRFLQLRHATHSQFLQSPPQPTPNPIIAVVKDTDPKKLISCFYNTLNAPVSAKVAYNLKPRWEGDVGPMENEEWEEAMESCKEVSPKLSDSLSQIYILHRAYLTLLRVARYRGNQPTTCPMCGTTSGTFFHLIWSCPQIQGLWKQIVTFLHDNMGSPVVLDPKQCLLGIFPDPSD